jgi:hypothetical protein
MIRAVWESSERVCWHQALDAYWLGLSLEQTEREKRLESLRVHDLAQMNADQFARFLREEYFKWKYTSSFLESMARKKLSSFLSKEGVDRIDESRRRLVAVVPAHAEVALATAKRIPGLGYAGASGLLALLFPAHFGTVDQFVVKELRKVPLPESWIIETMNPTALDGADSLVLIRIMQRKARELSIVLNEPWTPRMIDKVLWGVHKLEATGGA